MSTPQRLANATQEAEARIGPVTIVALGLATQRETTVVWSKVTGLPLHNAIVWMDSRTRCVPPLRVTGSEGLDFFLSVCL